MCIRDRLCMIGLKFDGGNLDKILKKVIQIENIVEPDAIAHENYNDYYLAYRQFYDLIGKFYEKASV